MRSAAVATPEAALTIVDDPGDLPPPISVADAGPAERAGGSDAQVEVSLSGPGP